MKSGRSHTTIENLLGIVFFVLLAHAGLVLAQSNPYQVVYNWGELPGGRSMGVVTGVQPDPDGEHIWIAERCGANQCAGSDLNPIHKLDSEGRTVKSIGAGLFAWPHGFDMDADGNLWVTEGAPEGDARGEPGSERGMGHQIIKLNQDGEVLMRLGEAGVPGDDAEHFNGPAAVLIGPTGEIWVADGHRGGNNRIMKFSSGGDLLLQLGGGVGDTSRESGLFNDPHDLKMDSQGRLFVADRGNNRIQIFSQEGQLLDIWTQFGRPSGLWIDADDTLYVADGMSGEQWNRGWKGASVLEMPERATSLSSSRIMKSPTAAESSFSHQTGTETSSLVRSGDSALKSTYGSDHNVGLDNSRVGSQLFEQAHLIHK